MYSISTVCIGNLKTQKQERTQNDKENQTSENFKAKIKRKTFLSLLFEFIRSNLIALYVTHQR